MSKVSKKKADKAEEQSQKPVVHNRLRPERTTSNDPKSKAQQDYYYANQQKLLDQKREYHKKVKEGIIVPKKKNDAASTPENKGKGRVYTKKYETDEQRHEAKLQSNRDWYHKNKGTILDQQSKHNEEKAAKAKEARKQQILDEWEKLQKELGNR